MGNRFPWSTILDRDLGLLAYVDDTQKIISPGRREHRTGPTPVEVTPPSAHRHRMIHAA